MNLQSPDLRLMEELTFDAVNDLRKSERVRRLNWDELLYADSKNQLTSYFNKYLRDQLALKNSDGSKRQQWKPNRVVLQLDKKFGRTILNMLSVPLGTVGFGTNRMLGTQSYRGTASTVAQLFRDSRAQGRHMMNKKFNISVVVALYDSVTSTAHFFQILGTTTTPLSRQRPFHDDDELDALPKREIPFHLRNAGRLADKDNKAIRFFDRLTISQGIMIGSYKHAKKALRGRRSGIVVESIPIEQYDSGAKEYSLVRNVRNGLHPFNGTVQRPTYRRKLLKISRSNSPRKLLLDLGIVRFYKRPRFFYVPVSAGSGEKIFLIKNRRLITYRYPLNRPGNLLETGIPPLYYQTSFNRKPQEQQYCIESTLDTVSVKVYYPVSSAVLDASVANEVIGEIKQVSAKIISVEASSFASVDGEMMQNQELARERVKNFMSVVQPYLQSKEVTPVLRSREQWNLFTKQIEEHGLTHLKGLPRRELRDYVNANRKDPKIEALLQEQRYTQFTLVTRQDSLVPIPMKDPWQVYAEEATKFEKSKSPARARLLEEAQLSVYAENMLNQTDRPIEVVNAPGYPEFAYHEFMYRFLIRKDINRVEFFKGIHSAGQSKYLRSDIRDQLVHNNLVLLYEQYGNSGAIPEVINEFMLDCRGYRRQQFLVRYSKSSGCKVPFTNYSNDYWMLKEFPVLMNMSRKRGQPYVDSLDRYFTTSIIRELYQPLLTREIFAYVNKIKKLFHPDDRLLSDEERIRLAHFYWLFGKQEISRTLLTPIVARPYPNPEALKSYMLLQHSKFNGTREYVEYIMSEFPRLGKEEWCSIWTEGRYLNYLMLEDQKLKEFYNCQCASDELLWED